MIPAPWQAFRSNLSRFCRVANMPTVGAARKTFTGKVLVAAQLARSYGFVDIDGKSPIPLTLNDA